MYTGTQKMANKDELETVEEELHDAFAPFGEIYDHVVIRDTESRRSRGFGFVTFEKPDSVQRALDSRPIRIGGKEVDVKRAVPRSESSISSESKTSKLFVGGILTSATEDQLRDAFRSYGKINNVDIMRDKEGRSRGFGFVVFEECESVDRIVHTRYISVNGKQVECKRAEPFGSLGSNKSRRPQESYSSQYEREMGGGRPRGRGRGRESYSDVSRYSPYSGGYRPYDNSASGYGSYEGGYGGESFGYGGRGYGTPSYGNQGYRDGSTGQTATSRQASVGGSYSSPGYQEYYASGFGRGGGYEASTQGSQYTMGKYEPEPSSFGPTRSYGSGSGGYSAGGSGGYSAGGSGGYGTGGGGGGYSGSGGGYSGGGYSGGGYTGGGGGYSGGGGGYSGGGGGSGGLLGRPSYQPYGR